MLEPRDAPDNINRPELRFLGGTENFDLWVRDVTVGSVLHAHEYPLRIHRVGGGSITWDVFKVPLHHNTELYGHMPPADRRIVGHWKDVELSAEDVQIIEAYLRCFAPGMLGEQTNEEPT